MEGCPVRACRTRAVHCILCPKVLTAGAGCMGEGSLLSISHSLFPPPRLTTQIPTCYKSGTYVFVCGLVGADQVRVETREANDGPDGEEAYYSLQHSGGVKETNRRRSPIMGFSGLPERPDVRRRRVETPQAGSGRILTSGPFPFSNQTPSSFSPGPHSHFLPPPPPVQSDSHSSARLLGHRFLL